MFAMVMSDPTVLKPFLELVLEMKIARVERTAYEKAFAPDYYSHGIRLDVYAADEKETRYNVEMQRRNEYNVGKRSRYYHSIMDVDALSKGVPYENLKDTFVIFVCEFDPFENGLQKYTFSSRCVEDYGLELEDGAQTIVLTNCPGEPEIEDFYRYLQNSTEEQASECGSDLVRIIHDRVRNVRFDPKMEVEYMRFEEMQREQFEKGKNLGWAEGKAEGRAEGRTEERALLAEVIRNLKSGVSADSLRNDGYNEETIELALSVL